MQNSELISGVEEYLFMPIAEEEWESATPARSDITFIQNFLEQNSDKAYSSADIAVERTDLSKEDGLGFTIMALYFESLLDGLVDQGRISVRVVDEITEENAINGAYYRAISNSES
jgi:hypothetical protein